MNDSITAVYADDQEMFRELLDANLPECFPGKQVVLHTGSNGNDLVRLVKKYQPKIILTDNHMSERNGSDAIRELRAAGFSTPILMLTGLLAETQRECSDLQGIHYLEKPYTSSRLLTKIREVWPQYT